MELKTFEKRKLSEEFRNLLVHRNKSYEELKSNQYFKEQCFKCEEKPLKPVRAHHCRYCQHDNLVMDHHCPWIKNCIGLENKGYFLLMTFYLNLGSTMSFICLHLTQPPEANNLDRILYYCMYVWTFFCLYGMPV
mmetsp:Transcript_455/g.518  ORF Transcript_455/g.518 Transcript_455/m.518 type:complete len:135 (+) Transcript_455:296-700(+)